jgi:hypothetical protein
VKINARARRGEREIFNGSGGWSDFAVQNFISPRGKAETIEIIKYQSIAFH